MPAVATDRGRDRPTRVARVRRAGAAAINGNPGVVVATDRGRDWPTRSGALRALRRQQRLDPLRRERHLANAYAGRVEERVAHRRGDNRDRSLAGAARLDVAAVDQHAL